MSASLRIVVSIQHCIDAPDLLGRIAVRDALRVGKDDVDVVAKVGLVPGLDHIIIFSIPPEKVLRGRLVIVNLRLRKHGTHLMSTGINYDIFRPRVPAGMRLANQNAPYKVPLGVKDKG